mmetsp:Transcript_42930/g.73233  ORF Transcript_42930/g.73233 Transcript_42930/m.73233 type:complete len:133 (+) Transcript_42930:518-916(+)
MLTEQLLHCNQTMQQPIMEAIEMLKEIEINSLEEAITIINRLEEGETMEVGRVGDIMEDEEVAVTVAEDVGAQTTITTTTTATLAGKIIIGIRTTDQSILTTIILEVGMVKTRNGKNRDGNHHGLVVAGMTQ